MAEETYPEEYYAAPKMQEDHFNKAIICLLGQVRFFSHFPWALYLFNQNFITS
jgi:hypothetical protein